MILHKRVRTGAVAGVIAFAALSGGCGPGLNGDPNSILQALSDFGITEDMTINDILNQVTVGEIVSGFVSFAENMQADGAWVSGHGLSDDELTEIEALQAQLDAGEITQDDFTNAVHDIIGDRSPGVPFAGLSFYGSPFGSHMQAPPADPLDLTEEQQAAAEEIFQTAHDDIDALRDAANESIRALLTEEQLATLGDSDLLLEQPADGPRGPHGMGRRGGGFGHAGFQPQSVENALDLTQEQQDAIDAILSDLHDAVEARHEQAHEDFLALLTDEQLALLGETTSDEESATESSTLAVEGA